jgi:hypothetical protein
VPHAALRKQLHPTLEPARHGDLFSARGKGSRRLETLIARSKDKPLISVFCSTRLGPVG